MTEVWQRLSVRSGKREPDLPFEGVPGHLRHPLGAWLRHRFGWNNTDGMNDGLMSMVAMTCRIPVHATYAVGGISDQIFAAIERDEDLYLDCLDATLQADRGRAANVLREVLQMGNSVWTVSADGKGLERRVPEASTQAFALAASTGDDVADELREAWGAVFGRNPNPSDAWDHAIKAVEDLLIPVVVPNAAKANLGAVAGELKANPARWEFGVPSNAGRSNGETLEGMIRLIWPNPDRHGGVGKRPPTQVEAEAVVQTAVAIVAICRGRLKKV